MRLANKFTITLGFGAALVLTAKAALDVSREKELFDNEALRQEQQLGHLLGAAVGEVWRAEGEARALELVTSAHAATDDVQVRWVWLDADAPPAFRPKLPISLLAPLRRGEGVTRKEPHLDDDGLTIGYTPVDVKSSRLGALEVSKSLRAENEYVRRSFARTLTATGILILLFVAMGAVFGAWFITRPVRALVEQLRRIGAGDLSGRLAISRHDELTTLALEMNAMTSQLRHADRLTTVGTVAAGLAHELGTPLHVVSNSAKAIAFEALDADEIKLNAKVIDEHARRMTDIIRNLLDFARRRELKRELFDLRHVADQAIKLLQPTLTKRQLTVRLEVADTPQTALIDLTQLQQAITNLVINAMHASNDQGRIEISVAPKTLMAPPELGGVPTPYVCILVRDFGVGMTEHVKRSVFEPFFTTKPVGEGTGLGLPIAAAIVREHDGFIDIETEVGKGSCFSICLPPAAE